jgi:hypothetical protein
MRYIVNDPKSGWDFQPYFSYLETVRGKMPAHVYAFASNREHYNLHSHSSLHDAWLEYLVVREPASGERKELRAIEIETCYLGPFRDCRIFLTYRQVQSFNLNTPAEFSAPPSYMTGHGDLLIHELCVEDNGLLVHELRFSRGSIFEIKCRDIEHRMEAHTHA